MPLYSGSETEPTREEYEMREEQEAEWSATRQLIVAPAEQQKSIYAALSAFQGDVVMIHKDGRNEFHKYNYASLEQWVEVLRPLLRGHGLAVTMTCLGVEDLPPLETSRGGTLRLVRVKARAVVMHTSGETITLDAYGEGSDQGDKAVYKAMTGARKYLLAALSGSATSDDPEDENPQRKQSDDTGRGAAPKKQVASEGISSLGAGIPASRPVTPRPLPSGAVGTQLDGPWKISEPQTKRLWAIWSKRWEEQMPDGSAEAKLATIKNILADFGYESSKDVEKHNYNAICSACEGWLPPDTQVPDEKWEA